MNGVRAGWRVAVPVACLVAGVLLGTTREAAQGDDLRPAPTTRLSDLVRAAQQDVAAAEDQRSRLVTDLDAAREQAGTSDAGVAAALARSGGLDSAAGLTAMSGPGLSVTLTDAARDSDGSYPADATPDDLVVHQQDLQSVLNGLWAGGAEAVTIQDQRVVATSAPRCIGNTLLLHGRTYSPPYVVTAIGNPDALRTSVEQQRGVAIYQQYVARFGLGFEVEAADDISVPAYAGSIRLSQAQEVPQ